PYARLMVDGLPATWFRHPGVEADPAPTPVFPRFLFPQVQVAPHATDGEWVGGNGGVVSAVSRRATTNFRFQPFVSWSGKPGVPAVQNPEDSSLTSFQAGALVSATPVENRARILAGFSYEEVTTPTARPWERTSATFGGASVPLAASLAAIAGDSFGVDVGPYVHSRVRTYRGGSGGFRLDWRLSDVNAVVARADFARFKERNPDLGQDVLLGAESSANTRDFSSEVALVSAWGESANEFRVGARSNERDWRAPRFASTYFVSEGAGIGARPELPGDFKRTSYDFSETFQYAFGPSGQNRFKAGAQYSNGIWRQNYLYGKGGIFGFGDLDQFGRAAGTYYRAEVSNDRVRYNFEDIGLFAQLQIRVAPSLTVLGGLRWDRRIFPKPGTRPIRSDSAFGAAFGIGNSAVPRDGHGFGPRLGLLWDGGPAHAWSGSLALGRYFGQLNPARFAEAVLNDGGVTVQRGVGSFATWPAAPDSGTAPYFARRFTLFTPGGYRDPRTFKADVQITHTVSGLHLQVLAGYPHTDFLPRVTDLNLAAAPSGTTQERRAV
ncbi:MAG TPA: TonB-dependent receptor, partial [Gemmatimonadales bacterium]|nr:TonB-dependent receptor [Gemmatimonadales bacterium]